MYVSVFALEKGDVTGANVPIVAVFGKGTPWFDLFAATVPPDIRSISYGERKFCHVPKVNMPTELFWKSDISAGIVPPCPQAKVASRTSRG